MREKYSHNNIDSFRDRIIDSTLLFGTFAGLIALIAAYLPVIDEPFKFNFYTDIGTFFVLVLVNVYRKKLSSKIKAIVVIGILLSFVISDVLIWGVFSFNKVLIVLIPFYSFLVFGFKNALKIFLFSIGCYVSFGLLQLNGYIEFTRDLNDQFLDYSSWIESTTLISVVGVIVLVFTHKYYEEISILIQDLKEKNIALEAREKTLAQEQTFTEGLLDGIPGLFNLFKKTEKGFELVKWNKNTIEISGLTDDELLGRDPLYIIHPDHQEQIKMVVKNISNGLSDGANAMSWNAKNLDQCGWYYFTGHPITYDNDEYFIGLGIDISEQKSVESSFLQEKEFSGNIIDIFPGVFYLHEKDGDKYPLKRWNQNLETQTGYSSDELKDKSPLDFFNTEYHLEIRNNLEKIQENEVVTFEAPLLKKNGEGDFWYFVGKKVTDESKEYLIGVGLDIADRKVMERELEHRNMNLKDMLDDMQLRNKKLAEYAFINSHMLRAPLVRILGLAELVSKEVILSEHQELLESFKTSAEELDAIVTKINETLDQRRDLNREDIIDALNHLNKKNDGEKTKKSSK